MEKGTSQTKKKGRGFRDRLGIFGPAILITLLGFIVAYAFVEPAPPRKITIATGDPAGAYYAFAQRYREILAREGVPLEIRSTAGSVENERLLGAKEGGSILPSCKAGSETLPLNRSFDLWAVSTSSRCGSFTSGGCRSKGSPTWEGKESSSGPKRAG